ncbi:TPA: hypothetical protein ACKFLM_004018 [Klebsiella oxytoca]|uniref:hypothetical protein n=1 Tax=Klebsiella sp. GW_Kp181 TaxID=3153492 RepID=UPI001CCDBC82|nr:hypothetical protein [Klebsiella oxytoca]
MLASTLPFSCVYPPTFTSKPLSSAKIPVCASTDVQVPCILLWLRLREPEPPPMLPLRIRMTPGSIIITAQNTRELHDYVKALGVAGINRIKMPQ